MSLLGNHRTPTARGPPSPRGVRARHCEGHGGRGRKACQARRAPIPGSEPGERLAIAASLPWTCPTVLQGPTATSLVRRRIGWIGCQCTVLRWWAEGGSGTAHPRTGSDTDSRHASSGLPRRYPHDARQGIQQQCSFSTYASSHEKRSPPPARRCLVSPSSPCFYKAWTASLRCWVAAEGGPGDSSD